MGFWRRVRKSVRARGVWLDAEQARVVLTLAQLGGLRGLSEQEEEILERFEKRCREFG